MRRESARAIAAIAAAAAAARRSRPPSSLLPHPPPSLPNPKRKVIRQLWKHVNSSSVERSQAQAQQQARNHRRRRVARARRFQKKRGDLSSPCSPSFLLRQRTRAHQGPSQAGALELDLPTK
jgi:hypothetical protein